MNWQELLARLRAPGAGSNPNQLAGDPFASLADGVGTFETPLQNLNAPSSDVSASPAKVESEGIWDQYAKDAKAPLVVDEPDLLHLLHTYYRGSQKLDSADEDHNREISNEENELGEKRSGAAIPATSGLPGEPRLKGAAVEIYSQTAGGTAWVVADEEDALQVMEKLSVSSGEIWTPEEVELAAQLNDPVLASELAGWKRRFGGALQSDPDLKMKNRH